MILSALLGLFLLYLLYERIALDRIRKSIPLVIAITGTRGKTSTARLLASVLRESGRKVVAKTTGSQAQIVLPDGKVEEIHRRGVVSIVEQKRALKTAYKLHADCLVVEMMSIRPENLVVESHSILKPNIVILTNVRRDHTEAMGETVEEIARALRGGIPDDATIYLLEAQRDLFEASTTDGKLSHLKTVRSQLLKSASVEFSENIDLVAAVARDLEVGESALTTGIQTAVHDIGQFAIWKYRSGEKQVYLVNAFAANDPESTKQVMEKTKDILGGNPTMSGLLNLRWDRPDRTMQWIASLKDQMGKQFSQVFVLGGHSSVVSREVKGVKRLTLSKPEEITGSIVSTMENNGVVFGFGNIGGAGRQLVEHWQQEGEHYAV